MAMIPWMENTARVIANVRWGGGRGRFEKDPRFIAESAESHLREKGYGSFFGPELEFFVFDKVELDV